jgi:SAM-dependent methyltransferase
MLPGPMYDTIAREYLSFARQANDPTTILGLATRSVLDLTGDVGGQIICDLGCGEGHLLRICEKRGALLVGVDISRAMLAAACSKRDGDYVLTDAQSLNAFAASAFDVVVSNLALMDIPDLASTYQGIHNILKAGGRFVFSILHPCFQSPYTRIEETGRFISRYATEGQWFSDGTGIRAKVGAYHRTIATYVNSLVEIGFMIEKIVEPTLPPDTYPEMSQNVQIEIPSIMVVKAVKK